MSSILRHPPASSGLRPIDLLLSALGVAGDPRFDRQPRPNVRCPAHDDRNASLSVTEKPDGKVLIHCFAGCASEDVLGAVGLRWSDLKPSDDSWRPMIRRASPITERAAAPADDVEALAAYLDQARAALDSCPEALAYIERRWGVDKETAIRRAGLGYDDGSLSRPAFLGRGFAEPRIVLPFYPLDGRPIATGLQARALRPEAEPKWTGPAGEGWARLAPFGAHLDLAAPVLITEGPGDALCAFGAGFAAIGIRGASLANGVVQELKTGLGSRVAYVIGDNDKPGAKFARELSDGLNAEGVPALRLVIPKPHNDLSEWCEATGSGFAAALREAVESLEWVELEEDDELESDLGNARRLQTLYGDQLRFTKSWGWTAWDGTRWQKDADHHAKTRAHSVTDALKRRAEAMQGEAEREHREAELLSASPMPDDEAIRRAKERARKTFAAAGRLKRHAETSQGSSRIAGMLTEASVLRGIMARPDDFDQKPHLLACANGTVDLRTGELRPHDRADMLTLKTDVAYIPSAQAPTWGAFLERVVLDGGTDEHDVLGFLQRYAGYAATGNATEHLIVIAHGTGANGKSTFVEALRDALGEYATAAGIDTFMERRPGRPTNDIAALAGSRLVTASEGEQGSRLSEATVKLLTGGDAVTARLLYRESFTFRPAFSLIIGTNHKPRIRGGESIWRRIALVPFTVTIPPAERDTRLTERLRAEREGVLAWIVRGAVEWHRAGLRTPPAVQHATESYRTAEDVLAGFFPGRWVTSREGFTSRRDVLADYQAWCEEAGVEPMRSSRALYEAMAERGAEPTAREGARGFRLARGSGASYFCTVDKPGKTENQGSRHIREFVNGAESTCTGSEAPDVGGASSSVTIDPLAALDAAGMLEPAPVVDADDDSF